MSAKRSAPTKALADGPKRQRKMLTIAEKVKLLDMLKEGGSYAAVGRHYGINESSVRSIKKEENNIRTTAAISFNKDAKRVANVRNKTMVRMESALALWINDCRKKNITLDTNVICTKAKTLYQTFADGDDAHDREEEEGEEGADQAGPSTSAVHGAPSAFGASKGWFDKFKKRFGLKNVSLHGEAAGATAAGADASVSDKSKAIIEEGGRKPDQVFNMDETGSFWKRMPSRTFIMQEEAKAPGFKAPKDRLTLVMCGNAAGFVIKPGLIYRSGQLGGDGFNDIDAHARPLTDADLAEMTEPPSDGGREEEEEGTRVVKEEAEEEEGEGLTLGRLATMLRMATELQRAAQEWDPLASRSLQFSNIIDGGMSVYRNLFAQKEKERQQLPITMLFSRKKSEEQ